MMGRPTKITSRARSVIVCKAVNVLRVTSEQLKASLLLTNVNVHESTIQIIMGKLLLTKKNSADPQCCLQFAKDHVENVVVS